MFAVAGRLSYGSWVLVVLFNVISAFFLFIMSPASTRATSVSTSTNKAIVQLHALSAGHLTLPERFFVHPASETERRTVPSLAFLVQHQHPISKKNTRIVFDLGLRRNIDRYSEPIRRHAATRQPLTTDPDVVKSLAAGGLTPEDIDYVVYSHVHWDHVGEPRDFPTSTFVVGNGALKLLQGGSAPLNGSHSYFEADLIPQGRTIELSDQTKECNGAYQDHGGKQPGEVDFHQPWKAIPDLPRVIDLFNDGSLYVVDAPGHLPGHINLLAKTGMNKQVYLAGDACHDRRIMRKQREIGEWRDSEGHICCIHANREVAEKTIDRIRILEQSGVEIIFAHDHEWEEDPRNTSRFWGARL